MSQAIIRFQTDLDKMISDLQQQGIANGDICRLLAKKISELDPEGAKAVSELVLKGLS